MCSGVVVHCRAEVSRLEALFRVHIIACVVPESPCVYSIRGYTFSHDIPVLFSLAGRGKTAWNLHARKSIDFRDCIPSFFCCFPFLPAFLFFCCDDIFFHDPAAALFLPAILPARPGIPTHLRGRPPHILYI